MDIHPAELLNLQRYFLSATSVTHNMSSALAQPIPAFDDLPLQLGDPHHSAWGLWKNPALGSLNHLTDEVVLRAVQEEVRTGERVTMKYALGLLISSRRLC